LVVGFTVIKSVHVLIAKTLHAPVSKVISLAQKSAITQAGVTGSVPTVG